MILVPRGETVWVVYKNRYGKAMFVITSKDQRDYYYFYEVSGNSLTKLGKSKNPIELETKFNVCDIIRTAENEC